MSKRVYLFHEGNADMRNLLGGKGANLAEMTNIGLPIPNGFTISTEACTDYYNDGKTINEDTKAQIFKASAIFWCIVSGAPTCEFFVFSSFSTVTPHSGSFSSPTVSGYTATRSMTCSFLL